MLTLALDASTKSTGWSVMRDGAYIDSGVIDMSKDKDIHHRIIEMTKAVVLIIKRFDPDKVFLEDTIRCVNVSSLKSLCWLSGGIQFWTGVKGYQLELIMPSAWRKYVHIQENQVKRAELKRRAIQFCEEHLGLYVDEDQSEAVVMNYAMAIRDGYIKGEF